MNRIRKRKGITNFRMHDFRKALASYIAINGSSLPIIGKALNHKCQVSTAIYFRLSDEPVFDGVNDAVNIIRRGRDITYFKKNPELFEKLDKTVRLSDLVK